MCNVFTANVRCSRYSRDDLQVYLPGAIGFSLQAWLSPPAAWFCVNIRTAMPWQDPQHKLFETRARLDGGGINNVTAGTVWLAVQHVATAP